ncbi:MAG: C10 family peptidase [Muribaculaceae bacterium]|nr:C10 family peptidase [Muribaculaceae bacterium]
MASETLSLLIGEARSSDNFLVESVQPWLTEEIYSEYYAVSRSNSTILPDTLLYVVNYKDNKACVLVSYTKELQGVVAVLPNQNLSTAENINNNPGFKIYMDLFKEAYLTGNINKLYTIDDFKKYIPEGVATLSADDEGWTTVTQYPVKLIQEWGQGAPYNKYCFDPNTGRQALAGCGPVALAQALTYFREPSTINGYSISWKSTSNVKPETDYEKDAVARLIHEVGVLCYAQYTDTATSVYPSSMANALKTLNYTYTQESFSNEIKMIHNLYQFGPAIMTGSSRKSDGTRISGHAWVIDGALAQHNTLYNDKGTRFLYHCNWGWNGNRNGYFLSTAFNPYGDTYGDRYKYNYDLSTIYFIQRP